MSMITTLQCFLFISNTWTNYTAVILLKWNLKSLLTLRTLQIWGKAMTAYLVKSFCFCQKSSETPKCSAASCSAPDALESCLGQDLDHRNAGPNRHLWKIYPLYYFHFCCAQFQIYYLSFRKYLSIFMSKSHKCSKIVIYSSRVTFWANFLVSTQLEQ